MRDNDLRSPNFLDVQKYPTITFKSRQAKAAGDGKLQIIGDLTIHGVTKEVTLDVDGPTAPIKNPMGGGLRMGASASTKINRKDFGVNGRGRRSHDHHRRRTDPEISLPAKKSLKERLSC
jgi:polyisoprenoid-binding protein YceI